MKRISKIYLLTFFVLFLSVFITHNIYPQLVSDFRVNDDTTNQIQFNARIDTDAKGNFIMVWTDWRNEKSDGVKIDVFCQKFQESGNFIGNNFRVNELVGTSSSPDIAVRKDGSFLVCWKDFNVKARIFDDQCIPQGPSFVVNDSVSNRVFNDMIVGSDSEGNFVVCWQEHIFNQNGNIFFQRLDQQGNKIGSNIKVNDDTIDVDHEYPAITVKNDGSFIVVWNDYRPPSLPSVDDIYMQMFDKSGNKIGSNQKVNDDFGNNNRQFVPKISSDSIGNFVIGWNDNRQGSAIYIQRYLNTGDKIGVNYKITQSSVNNGKGISSVDAKPNGEFIVYFTEFRNNLGTPYFQRFRSDGSFIGNNFPVTAQAPSTEKFSSDVNLFNDRIISVWTDARNGPFDVYCNIRSFTNPDTTVSIIQTSSLVPENFSLNQNYPNPFNNTTQIGFNILQNNNYKLEIYNSIGQKVKEVFNIFLNTGSYKINFESGNISSGVYQYILSSPKERFVKSFVLLK